MHKYMQSPKGKKHLITVTWLSHENKLTLFTIGQKSEEYQMVI